MTARPIEIPELDSTDTNSVEPLSTYRETGFQPGDRPPAQYFNWLHQVTGQWLRHLRNRGAKQVLASVDTVGAPGALGSSSWAPFYSQTNQRWVVIDFAGALRESASGTHWGSFGRSSALAATPFDLNNNVAAENPVSGEVVVTYRNNSVITSSGQLSTWATKANGRLSFCATYDAFNGQFLLGASAGRVLSFPNAATAATDTATAVSGGASDIVSSPTGLTVMTTLNGEVVWSADASTWNDATANFQAAYTGMAPAAQDYRLAYDPSSELFMVCVDNGLAVLTSPDGATWTERVASSGVANEDVQGLQCVADGMFARLVSIPNNTDFDMRLQISEDAGATWETVWTRWALASTREAMTLSAKHNRQLLVLYSDTTPDLFAAVSVNIA